MTPEDESLQTIHQQFLHFVDGFNSVILATVAADGSPESSYAPVIQHGQNFYIYVSELAAHTQNLLVNPQASLLFIGAEEQTNNLFARQRATIKVTAEEIARDTEQWLTIMDLMAAKFGNMIELLRTLKDFHLFGLQPQSAAFVQGFGKAYRLEGDDLTQVTYQTR